MSIIPISTPPGFPDFTLVHAAADQARDMGRFGSLARYQPDSKAYWVETKHLATVVRELERSGHTILDRRPSKGRGAPKRCGFCHQVHHFGEDHLGAPDPNRNARGAAMVRAAMRGELPPIPQQTTLDDVTQEATDA